MLFSIGCGGLVGGLHRAVAGVLQAHVLDHLHRGGNVFVAFAGLFGDQPQVLAAAVAVLFRLRQIVHDAFALQMPRQRLPPAAFLLRRFVRFRPGSGIAIEVIVVLVGSGFGFRAPCLPGRLEQRQLLFRQLLALAVALRFQQFAQQTLILVLLGRERSSCSARSTTIFRSVSASCGSCSDRWPPCISDYAETGPFPSKNNSR